MTDSQSPRRRLLPCPGSEEEYIQDLENTLLRYVEYVNCLDTHDRIGVPDHIQARDRSLPFYEILLGSNFNNEHTISQDCHEQQNATFQHGPSLSCGLVRPRMSQNVEKGTSTTESHPSRSVRQAFQWNSGQLHEVDRSDFAENLPNDTPTKDLWCRSMPTAFKPRQTRSPGAIRRGASSTAKSSSDRGIRQLLASHQTADIIFWDANKEYNGNALGYPKSNPKVTEFSRTIPKTGEEWSTLVERTNLLTAKDIVETFRLLTLESSPRTTTAPSWINGSKSFQVLQHYPNLCAHLDREANRAVVLRYFARLMLWCISRVLKETGLEVGVVDDMIDHSLTKKYHRDCRETAKNVAALIEQLEASLGCIASQFFLMGCVPMKKYQKWDKKTRAQIFEEVHRKLRSVSSKRQELVSPISFSPTFLITFMEIADLNTVNKALGTNIAQDDYDKRAAPLLKSADRNYDTVSPANLIIDTVQRNMAFVPNGDQNIMLGALEVDMDGLRRNTEYV